MAFYERPDLGEGRVLEEGWIPQQGLVPQLFDNPDVRYRPQRITPRRSVIEITKFGGEDREDLVEWMDNWNRAAAANGWTLEEEQVMLPLYLTNRASQHYRNIPQRIKSDITLLKKELEDHFNSPSQKLQCRHLLGERYQKP